ncbi:MAG: hypothetical protein ACFFCI_16585 [Promethearchaeota archaeon]
MTTQDVARTVAKELTLKEEDFYLSLECITLSSEDVIPPSVRLLLIPGFIAGGILLKIIKRVEQVKTERSMRS